MEFDLEFKKLLIEFNNLKYQINKKYYNKTKNKCVSFRFDKNKINYDLFKQKLEKNNLSITEFFTRAMNFYLEND